MSDRDINGSHLQLGLAILLSATVASITGCGETGPTAYPVHGQVTYRGNPIPTGTVMFLSESAPAATAIISADGNYHTQVVAGSYTVTVSAFNSYPSSVDPTAVVDFKPPPPLVPWKFSLPSKSGLSAEVSPDAENVIDFNLN